MDILRELRESRGMNMAQAAAALGMKYTTYVSYEKGERQPHSEQLITCGLKTEAGKNRIVPIHPMIKDVVAAHMGGEVLFPSNGKKQTYKAYAKNRWNPMMESLGMEHHTHDCRKTFRSALDRAGANKVAVDRIIGHKSGDVGERVYTLKTIDELREAILKLDYGLSDPLGK